MWCLIALGHVLYNVLIFPQHTSDVLLSGITVETSDVYLRCLSDAYSNVSVTISFILWDFLSFWTYAAEILRLCLIFLTTGIWKSSVCYSCWCFFVTQLGKRSLKHLTAMNSIRRVWRLKQGWVVSLNLDCPTPKIQPAPCKTDALQEEVRNGKLSSRLTDSNSCKTHNYM